MARAVRSRRASRKPPWRRQRRRNRAMRPHRLQRRLQAGCATDAAPDAAPEAARASSAQGAPAPATSQGPRRSSPLARRLASAWHLARCGEVAADHNGQIIRRDIERRLHNLRSPPRPPRPLWVQVRLLVERRPARRRSRRTIGAGDGDARATTRRPAHADAEDDLRAA